MVTVGILLVAKNVKLISRKDRRMFHTFVIVLTLSAVIVSTFYTLGNRKSLLLDNPIDRVLIICSFVFFAVGKYLEHIRVIDQTASSLFTCFCALIYSATYFNGTKVEEIE